MLVAAACGSLLTVGYFHPWRLQPQTPVEKAAAGYSSGLSALYSGRMREAVRRFTLLIKLTPNDPKAYYFRGLAYRDLRSLPDAIADFSRAVELDPSLAGARWLRALSRRELGDLRGSLADLEALLADGKERPELLAEKASLLVALGRRAEALKDLDAALTLKPAAYFPLVRRGELRSQLKKGDDAQSDFDAAIKLEPSLAPAYVSKANDFKSRGLWKDAEAAAREAIERLPGRADLHILKGYINEQQFKRDAALADYTTAIGLSPRSQTALLRRANAYREIGIAEEKPEKFQLGIIDLNRAIELAPKDPGPRKSRSNLYTWAEDLPKALEDAKAVLTLDSRSWASHDALADVYRLMDRHEDALAANAKAIDLDPYSSGARITRCATLSAMRRAREAIAECDKAVEYDPASTEPLFHRGHAKLAAGFRAEALADARKVLAMDPSDARFRKLFKEASQMVSF